MTIRACLKLFTRKLNKMSVFVQKSNPMTGVDDWIVQQEDYDYHQEVARASFADMLHDTERNQKYESALKAAIEIMHANGKKANVLDIGTGTGLLSMMAVRHGADSVTACEAFQPMTKCALQVIKRNGCENRIKLISKRSTDIIVGPTGDLQEPCNILVTEVFDTELIGEGALLTFSHAHKVLLEKECIVVPHSATIYAQIVDCPMVQNWNKVKDVYSSEGKLLVQVPDKIKNCAGSASVHDIQLGQLKLELIKTIAAPTPVFRFDWSGKTPFIFDQSTIQSLKAEHSGSAQAVLMWWDLQMDTEGANILSCAPYWAHPLSKDNFDVAIPWRDHWMQAVYYLPQEVKVEKGQEINLISCHDEYSLWFNLKTDLSITDSDYVKPICECGMHASFSRTRIGQINDGTRNKKHLAALEKHITNRSTVLVLSDGFYLSLAAAKLGAKYIYYIEPNFLSRRILLDFISFNKIENVEVFQSVEDLSARSEIRNINLVLGEPYFVNSILPWDNFLFLYLLKGVRHILSSDVEVLPKAVSIKGVAVHFNDLHKIRMPLGICEGFVMKDFDELIETSSTVSDDDVEAQPLWEYPGIALSEVVDIMSIDLTCAAEKVLETSGVFNIEKGFGGCNGIALWVEWSHDDNFNSVISSGPICKPQVGHKLDWDMHTRQAVCLFSSKDVANIAYEFKFDFLEGNISFRHK